MLKNISLLFQMYMDSFFTNVINGNSAFLVLVTVAYHLVIVFPIAIDAPWTADGQHSIEKSQCVQ